MRPWAADYVARRLVKLVAEHGAPNSFSCAEVADGERVIRSTRVGTIGRRHVDDLAAALRDLCADFTVEYRVRRFHVAPKKEAS